MTTHKEALTLALNALNRITHRFDLESVAEDATKAITAIKEALAQPDEKEAALLRALEIIAVGDANNPQAQAAEELIALGYWRDIPEAIALAQPEQTDSMGIPLSCGKPACSPNNHHPLCKLAQPEQEPVAGEPAPENSLPTWSECNLIIENDEFRKRAEAGLEGQVLDTPRTTPAPTALHYFIYEYDDADPYRSVWFLHRLECVLKEVTTQPQRNG